jgi:hypothetical protein
LRNAAGTEVQLTTAEKNERTEASIALALSPAHAAAIHASAFAERPLTAKEIRLVSEVLPELMA